jgi:hypothetical protein
MGLFRFFNRNGKHAQNGLEENLPEIREDTFIEKENSENGVNKVNLQSQAQFGITQLYEFLDKNYESKGYDDALVNPDTTHLEQNIAALKNDLERSIRKVKTFYEDYIREINFHISSRSRIGMVDTVEELQAKKEKAEDHIKQVAEIEEQAKNNQGVGYGIIISYSRGFRNGLAAISHHEILRRNF